MAVQCPALKPEAYGRVEKRREIGALTGLETILAGMEDLSRTGSFSR